MNKRLYVGGLSYSVDDDMLRTLFEAFGKVVFVKVIRDFHSGRSKGFGFVEMETAEAAQNAIEALNGSVHEGRSITVSHANPPDSSGGGNRGGARSGGGSRGAGGSGSGGGYRRSSGGDHRRREREEY